MSYTYSFLDVNAALVGPGGTLNLGAGSASSDEGITISPSDDIDAMMIGADGAGMHSLRANKSGKVTCRFLKNSPINARLSTMLAFQRTSGAVHGQNTLSVVNKASGDAFICQQVAFAKQPEVNYAKDGDVIVWEFNAILIDMALGSGLNG